MTYNDLCAEISALGFESDSTMDDIIISAARRAMMSIYTECPVYKTLSIYKNPSKASRLADLHHKGGECEKISCCAIGYSFRVSGSGSYRITDEAGEKTVNFAQDSQLHHGVLHGRGFFEFFGEYSYTVYDIILFDELYGELSDTAPILNGYREYDIRSYARDFLSFTSAVTDEKGKEIHGAYLSSGKINIPESFSGKFTVTYKCKPQLLSGNADEVIILPDGCEHLLALLTASYVWLDDDAEKAQYYLSLYRDGISAVKVYNRTKIDSGYIDVNGWGSKNGA